LLLVEQVCWRSAPQEVAEMRRIAVAVVLTLAAVAWPSVPGPAHAVQTPASVTAASVRADFDNDGFADLAVGVPTEDVGTVFDAGAVNVLYGGVDGLSGAGSQHFTQDSPELPDTAEDSDLFGAALAVQ
jgi:hypothetical protein